MAGQMDEETDREMDGQKDEQPDKRMDRQRDGWTHAHIHTYQ